MRELTRLMAGLLLLLVVPVACGSDDGGSGSLSEPQAELAAGLQELMDTSGDASAPEGLAEDAECAADTIAAGLTDERIEELGLTRETVAASDAPFQSVDFTEEERAGVIEGFTSCVDIEQLAAEATGLGDAADQLSVEALSCMLEATPEGEFEELLVKTFLFGESAAGQPSEETISAALSCMSAEDLQGAVSG